MRYLVTRLGSFAGLLAISGAALAAQVDFDGAINLPEPGVLELTAIAAVIGLVIAGKTRRRLLAALLAALSLMAVTIPASVGVASAASTSTTCQQGDGNSCFLEISAPESVAVGQPFTVKVTLWEYGFGDNPDIPLPKSDFCASKAGVSLDVQQGDSLTTYFSKASAGIATFSVSVPAEGSWSLHAYVSHPEGSPNCGYFDDGFAGFGEPGFTALNVPAGQPIAPCPDNNLSCVQVTNNPPGGSAATLFANDGSGTFDPAQFEAWDPNLSCALPDGTPVSPTDPNNGVLNFEFTGGSLTTEKTIVMTLKPSLVNKGVGQFNICWVTKSGPFPVAGGGNATQIGLYWVGYLPNCSPQASAPCVLYRTSNQLNAAFFGILAPPGDPKVWP